MACIVRYDDAQLFGDGLLADIFQDKLIESLAVKATAEIEVVLAGCPAGESNIRDVWPGTSVRAACHPNGDRLIIEIVPSQNLLNLSDEVREIALGLRHGESTGRNATQAIALRRKPLPLFSSNRPCTLSSPPI